MTLFPVSETVLHSLTVRALWANTIKAIAGRVQSVGPLNGWRNSDSCLFSFLRLWFGRPQTLLYSLRNDSLLINGVFDIPVLVTTVPRFLAGDRTGRTQINQAGFLAIVRLKKCSFAASKLEIANLERANGRSRGCTSVNF